jgi:muramidase (phage lysozyme)
MAIFNPTPNPTNDPSYLNLPQDLDKPKPNVSTATLIEGAASTLNAGVKAATTFISDQIEQEAYHRAGSELGAAGVDLATEAAAAGVPIGTTKGDPANNIFNDPTGENAARRPAGLDRFEKRITALKQKYDEGGMSESYFAGRMEAHAREMINRYGSAWEPDIRKVLKSAGGVDANSLRRAVVADLDRAERAGAAKANSDETFVRQNLEYMSEATLLKWQQKQIPFAQVQAEVAGYQRDKADTARDHARLQLKAAQGQADDREIEQVANTEINRVTRQRLTAIVDNGGGVASIREWIQSGKKPTPDQGEQIRAIFAAEREKTSNLLRTRLNAPVYDKMPVAKKEAIIAEGMKEFADLEKALTDNQTGVLFRTATYLEAQRDHDMRVLIDKNEGARKLRAVSAMDRSGTILNTMLMDDRGGMMSSVVRAGRQIAAANLITGEGGMTGNLDNIHQAGAGAESTRELATPAAVRQSIKDFKTLITTPGLDPEVVKNIAKGGFGPGEQNFLRRFKADSRTEIFTTMASPAVTKVMAQFKESDPQLWNMYTKSVADSFAVEGRRIAKDLKDQFAQYQHLVTMRYDDESMRFVVEPKQIGAMGGPGVQGRDIANTEAMQKRALVIADQMNANLQVMRPVMEATGGDKNAMMRDVLKSVGIDPNNPRDKGFWESVSKLWTGEPDPEKNPFSFNDLSRPGMPDDNRDETGLFSLQGDVGKPDDVQAGVLRTIRRAEAGNVGNAYRKVFGTRNEHPLDTMTINQVKALQSQMRASGSPSTAVGAYQFLNKTLTRLQTEMGLTGEEKFDAQMQDRLAVALMKGRGYDDWQAGKITRKQFVDNLAKEWAGLPNTSGQSHYHGDGLNKATIKLRDLLAALPQPELAKRVNNDGTLALD